MIYITSNQYNAVSSLAFHISNEKRSLEHSILTHPEAAVLRNTVLSCFDECDALQVPFSVQNAAIAWAQEWRNTLKENCKDALARRGIYVKQ